MTDLRQTSSSAFRRPRSFARTLVQRAATVVVAGLAAAGCSQIKLAYSWADWLIESQIDTYLDLDSDQSLRAERYVDATLAWHRREMLPQYVAILERAATVHESGRFEPGTYADLSAQVEALYRRTVAGSLAGVADILASQKGEQIEYLATQLAERETELLEEMNKPAAELLDERVEGFTEFFERFMGDLNDSQVAMLRSRLAASMSDSKPWMENRRARVSQLLTTLRNGANAKDVEAILRSWWIGEGPALTEEYGRYRDAFMVEMKKLIYDVLASMTVEQRQEMVTTLRDYAKDLAELTRG